MDAVNHVPIISWYVSTYILRGNLRKGGGGRRAGIFACAFSARAFAAVFASVNKRSVVAIQQSSNELLVQTGSNNEQEGVTTLESNHIVRSKASAVHIEDETFIKTDMKKQVFSLLLFCSTVTSGQAFVVVSTHPQHTDHALRLTPDQAPYLEECAADLMKAAIVAQAAAREAQKAGAESEYYPVVPRKSRVPVWCQKVIHSITHHHDGQQQQR